MEELKHPQANNGLVMNNGETNMQKYFADWQNGELLNSVRYYLNVQNNRITMHFIIPILHALFQR